MVHSPLHFSVIVGITVLYGVVFVHWIRGRSNELRSYCKKKMSEIVSNKNFISYNPGPYYKIYNKCKINLLFFHASEDGPKRPKHVRPCTMYDLFYYSFTLDSLLFK
jgi:hypothetical protein